MSNKINKWVIVDYFAHGINNLNKLLHEYFLLLKPIAEKNSTINFYLSS